jgi:predicted thioesterase
MGPWVGELEHCWRAIPAGEQITVRLNAVSFIDDRGKTLLQAMGESGVDLVAEGCMTKAIVEAISAKTKK